MTHRYNQGVADANRRRTKHGGSAGKREGAQSRLYTLWCGIKQRCLNPDHKHYHRYGGRGVTVCQEWADSFEVFREAVGEPPAGMTLDRIDNDKGYEPSNVRWTTRKEQANNRSTNVVLTWEGKTMTLKQWAEHLEWPYGRIASRWKKGKRGEELFRIGTHERNSPISHKGRLQTLVKWSEETGVPYETLWWRYRKGLPLFPE